VSKELDGSSVDNAANEVSVSVIVCAYTLDRWDLLVQSLSSLIGQDVQPIEVFLSVDHNEEMFLRCRDELPQLFADMTWPLRVIQNRFDTHLGGARTTAAELAIGDVLAFLDDDASATSSWLRTLTAPYKNSNVIAVGGAPIPRYEASRPRWFPFECNWIFGCAYRGLPERLAPIDHVIGANMSIRREALLGWGGFKSDNHDDMDLSHRTVHIYGEGALLFEPRAIVFHFVPKARLTWQYFWRRCFFVNRGKVAAFRGLDEASNMRAEFKFALRSLARAVFFEGRATLRGDVFAPVRYVALVCAIALGGAGAVVGRLQ
jgi:cellulose synthase/poly-beta-1,6-N-acetylglucosamine synthase-like glycosyltransferase